MVQATRNGPAWTENELMEEIIVPLVRQHGEAYWNDGPSIFRDIEINLALSQEDLQELAGGVLRYQRIAMNTKSNRSLLEKYGDEIAQVHNGYMLREWAIELGVEITDTPIHTGPKGGVTRKAPKLTQKQRPGYWQVVRLLWLTFPVNDLQNSVVMGLRDAKDSIVNAVIKQHISKENKQAIVDAIKQEAAKYVNV